MTPEPRVSRWDEARARCDAADEAYRQADTYLGLCAIPSPPNTAATLKQTRVEVLPIIGAATDDLRAALDAIDAVLALHQRDEYGRCSVCLDWIDFGEEHMHRWPCPTAAALGAE